MIRPLSVLSVRHPELLPSLRISGPINDAIAGDTDRDVFFTNPERKMLPSPTRQPEPASSNAGIDTPSPWVNIVGPSGMSIKEYIRPLCLANGDVAVLQDCVTRLSPEFKERSSATKTTCEIFHIADIEGVILCFFNSRWEMNIALNRISGFVEETGNPLRTHRLHATNKDNKDISGHDIRAEDLRKYLEAFDRKHTQWKVKPEWENDLQLEKDFRDEVIRSALAFMNEPVLITSLSNNDWIRIVSHEMCHAQFFKNPDFREAVLEYWRCHVSQKEKDKLAAIKIWSSLYAPENEELQANEFMAYNFMSLPDPKKNLKKRSFFNTFRDRHRAAYLQFMANKGLSPLAVNVFDQIQKGGIPT